MNFQEWSYNRHTNIESSKSQSESLPSCYTNPKSIDAWRHRRMHEIILPLLKFYPKSIWMTIGDGSYASDAHFLREHGLDVTATSLDDKSLSVAKERGFIEKYKAENAESISFAEDTFDFVFCKEAYHHFPRPPVAFYEMLRVCSKGVVLIEPQGSSNKLLNFLKDAFKKWFRKDKTNLFEESGNFIYRIDIKEIEKMMTALNYKVVASKKFNDFYFPKFSECQSNKLSFPFLMTKFGCFIQDIGGFLNLMDFGLACVIVFKEIPSTSLLSELKHHNFHVHLLPKNPFL
jgi:ubiquinone/menaquinone biosynthesis C-methylase UbiE